MMREDNPYAPPRDTYASEKPPGGSVLALLRDAGQLYRAHFRLIAAVILIVYGPVNFVAAYMEMYVFAPDDFMRSFRIEMFLDSFIGIIAEAAVISICVRVMVQKKTAFGEVMEDALSSWGRIWATRLLAGLAIVLGFLLLIAPGIWLAIRLLPAETIAVTERCGAPAAMRRSFEVTRNRFGYFFLLAALIIGAMVLVAALTEVPLLFASDTLVGEVSSRLVVDFVGTYFTVCVFAAYYEAVHGRSIQGQGVAAGKAPVKTRE